MLVGVSVFSHIFHSKSEDVLVNCMWEPLRETLLFVLKAKNGQNYLIFHMKAFHESFKSGKKLKVFVKQFTKI